MAHKAFSGGQDAPLNQRLAGRIEPSDPAWKTASPALRREFYRVAGDLAVTEKRKELARAIGSNGRRMRARKEPRKDGANGPVLTPHDAASRTARLMAARAWDAGCTLFWHSGIRKGQAKPWGVILGYHAAGKVKGAPIRDVRLSTKGIGAVRKAMATWWAARVKPKAAAQKTAPERGKSATRKAQAELTKKYRFLKQYLRDPKDGF
jgi:hypothetical protein